MDTPEHGSRLISLLAPPEPVRSYVRITILPVDEIGLSYRFHVGSHLAPAASSTSDHLVVLSQIDASRPQYSKIREGSALSNIDELLDAIKSQLSNSRFAWLAEINARAIAIRPFVDSRYRPRHISVHDQEYSRLTMSHPYYGFVAATVSGLEILMYSANDDNVARTYFYYGSDAYETLSLRIWHALARDASCIYDIGAFTGVYSLVARGVNPAATCVAFEPMAHIRHRATMNFVLNGRTGSIRIEPYALSDKTRLLPLYTSVGASLLDSGGSLLQRAQTVESIDLVQVIALDQYRVQHADDRPSLIKIDVEGHEIEVLRGARKTLEENRPALLVEISKTNSLTQAVSTLHAAGYRTFSVNEPLLTLHEHVASRPMRDAAFTSIEDVHNLLACPDDRTLEICLEAVAAIRLEWEADIQLSS